ncbi:conserved Plasmodium protein, unknown function [Plasmodium gallinaceum]|uniref:Uncharacterized protein n=1 Tax=Plasmodium gallinaceum TaxID=5849 RepID=A0A1J1GMC7_PLAGA|nr:conserved Plasmodium protein, unknown function [Plasmodium gallinaceum]CRG93508.1 conserved Plasmodium protein, unknown function [Plasmodium gallinaceum]
MQKNENTNCQFFQNYSENKNMCNEDYKLNNDIINDENENENENLMKNENNKKENIPYKHESKTDITSNTFDDTLNINLNNDNNEDKIIKNYLNDQINNVISDVNKEKENEPQYVDKIRDSNSDMDDLPLLKTYNNSELKIDDQIINKKEKKNEENSEEIIKKKDSLNNKENVISNTKENHVGSEVSSDDEFLLNLIKNDNKLKKNTENICDKSSYDSDEPILIRSKIENKNNNKKITDNNNENANVVKNISVNHSNKTIEKKLNNNVKKINTKKVSVNKNSINKGNTTKKINSMTKNKPRKLKKKKKNKKKERKKKNTENKLDKDYNDNDIEKDSIVIGTFDPRNRSNKEKLVAQLLIRWWYVLPDWPLPDYNYDEELKKRKLKLVSLEEYEDKEDIDKDGFRKVYQISAFPGVFRDAMGKAYDLRDKNTCPCYNNLIKKTDYELLELICEAIKNQLKCLKNSVYNEAYNEKRLEKELKDAELKLSRITKKNKQK